LNLRAIEGKQISITGILAFNAKSAGEGMRVDMVRLFFFVADMVANRGSSTRFDISVVRFRDFVKFKSNFLTVEHNIMFNPIFGMLSSRAIQNIPNMLGYL